MASADVMTSGFVPGGHEIGGTISPGAIRLYQALLGCSQVSWVSLSLIPRRVPGVSRVSRGAAVYFRSLAQPSNLRRAARLMFASAAQPMERWRTLPSVSVNGA
jgi:hypothetical protein